MIYNQPDKERIVNTYDLVSKLEKMEREGTFTWDDCYSIWYDFCSRKKELQRVVKLMNAQLHTIDGEIAHSIRSRVKDADSLIRKLIICKSDRQKKYQYMTRENYYMFVTDMIGCRILTRYHHQWKEIHKELVKMFDRDNKKTVDTDYIKYYVDNPKLIYFAEKPKAYYVHDDEEKLYTLDEGPDINREKLLEKGYRGVHYIIKYKNQYIEIQVRTIFEEGWSECNHEFYKLPEGNKRAILATPSSLLSNMAHQSDILSQFIYSTLRDMLPIRPVYCQPDACHYDPDYKE